MLALTDGAVLMFFGVVWFATVVMFYLLGYNHGKLAGIDFMERIYGKNRDDIRKHTPGQTDPGLKKGKLDCGCCQIIGRACRYHGGM